MMLKDTNIISVITVCYNCKNDIEPTILSVISQTHARVEYIVIDGGSTDGTLNIINKYKNKIDVLISEPDNGIFDAMNKGLKQVTGSWVNFMNAGDIFFNENVLLNIFSNSYDSELAVIYGNTYRNGVVDFPKDLNSLYYGGIMACHQSIFYNVYLCKNELYYNTKHRYYGDIELTRRLFLRGFNFLYFNITVASYKGGGFSSIVSNKARLAKFDYLYCNMGIKGLFYGLIGKFIFLFEKYIK